jgi:hypothetical protein
VKVDDRIDIATADGIRSAFRDWVGDETSFPREVAEAALVRVVGGVEGDIAAPTRSRSAAS